MNCSLQQRIGVQPNFFPVSIREHWPVWIAQGLCIRRLWFAHLRLRSAT